MRVIKKGFHWTFGWVRTPSQDCEHGYAYERPDGQIVWSHRPDHRHIAYLARFEGADGKRVVRFSVMNTRLMARSHRLFRGNHA